MSLRCVKLMVKLANNIIVEINLHKTAELRGLGPAPEVKL